MIAKEILDIRLATEKKTVKKLSAEFSQRNNRNK